MTRNNREATLDPPTPKEARDGADQAGGGAAAVERARYHPIDAPRQTMARAGYAGVWEKLVVERCTLTSVTSFQDKAFSCLPLIPEQEFQVGLARPRHGLAAEPVQGGPAVRAAMGSAARHDMSPIATALSGHALAPGLHGTDLGARP